MTGSCLEWSPLDSRRTTSISGRARRSQGSMTNSRCARSAACDSSAIIARKVDAGRLNARSPPSKRKNPLRGNLHGVTISPRPLRSVEANRGRRTTSISGRARRRQGQRSDLAARAPLHALVGLPLRITALPPGASRITALLHSEPKRYRDEVFLGKHADLDFETCYVICRSIDLSVSTKPPN